ncbi:MAG TPA: serine hydrolase domain-containing protein, partial [Phenylobacterium sp.]
MYAFDRRRILGLAAGAALTLPPIASAKSVAAAQAAMDGLAKSDPFYGVFLLGQGARTDFARAYGMADIEAGRLATAGTRYGVASISKWFTAVAVLRLVEQGRLSLDAPITTWLKDYRADTGAKLTLRRLLSNTSGVPNGFINAVRADATLMTRQTSTAEAVRTHASGDLIFEPGARFDYSLTNWILVRAILEQAAGEPYEAAMRRLVLAPLGL